MRGLLYCLMAGACLAQGDWAADVSNAETGRTNNEDKWTVVGSGRMDVALLRGDAPQLMLKTMIHGPGLKRTRLKGMPTVKDGVRTFSDTIVFYKDWACVKEPFGGRIGLSYALSRTDDKTFELRYVCQPENDVQLARPTRQLEDARVWLGVVLMPGNYFEKGTCSLEFAHRGTEEFPFPPPPGSYAQTKSAIFKTADGQATKFSFDPPLQVHCESGEVRFWLESKDVVRGGESFAQRMTMELPSPAAIEPDNRWVDTSDWFPIHVDNDATSPSVVGMQDWQDRPAGCHGFVQLKGDRLEFEDGTPVKFWGVNFATNDVDEKRLDRWAEILSNYGVNISRLVVFGRPNYPGDWNHFVDLQDVKDGLEFDRRSLELFDYACARLKEHGIYYGFSPFWGWFPTPADKQRMIAYDELMKILRRDVPEDIRDSFYGLTCIAPDLQDLMIRFHVKLLNHVNPRTGLRYADDPAVAYVELQNEDNIFLEFFNLDKKLAQCPAYKKLFYQRFADWLAKKYGRREKLAEAWGERLAATENLEEANITPFPGWFEQKNVTRRIADQMTFLYDTQMDFYRRFAAAVRATGYKGPLQASNWVSNLWLGHLHNVRSDREIGTIDRHAYTPASLQEPGVGLLSSGLQAVHDRPFSFSEWAGDHNVGMRLDVPLVGIYGMGLQGWDMSMQFAWNKDGIMPYECGLFSTCNNFHVLCQYPAMARAVRRMDAREGVVVARRRVSIPALVEKGDVGFEEKCRLLGAANDKRFIAAVDQAALAAGRVVLEYVDGHVDRSVLDDSARYIDRKARTVNSTTGQLHWDYSGRGFFTVNTRSTQGVVGYGSGKTHVLDDVTIAPETPCANIYVTALGPRSTIADGGNLLITTVARAVDRGTVFDEFTQEALKRPAPESGPLLVEPVKATITLKGRKAAKVFALDHDGCKAAGARPLAVERTEAGLRFVADGVKTRTVYYVVEGD